MNRSMIVIAMVSCALAAPLAAQQPQAIRDDSAAATAPAVAAPAPVAAAPVGPRIPETPRRIQSSLNSSTSLAYQEGERHSGLVYVLVVAILVVVLIILIKQA